MCAPWLSTPHQTELRPEPPRRYAGTPKAPLRAHEARTYAPWPSATAQNE